MFKHKLASFDYDLN